MKIHRVLIAVLLICAAPGPGDAHPSTVVVMDSRGHVYYSDLENVWMIMPDGTKRIAVGGVHTHELWIDSADRLYGEDVRNVGEKYRHRVWIRSPDGTISDTLPWRPGHPNLIGDYSFTRDRVGRSFILRRAERTIDVRRGDSTICSIGLETISGFLHWMTLGGNGDLFLSAGADLYRIQRDSGRPVLLADDLLTSTKQFSFAAGRHAAMGMWTDSSGNVYLSVYSGQVVRKIAPDGAVSTAFRSEAGWSPSGGLYAGDGSTWIEEFSTTNDVRIRRIAPDGTTRIFE